jgi:hypothetical protein
MTKKILTTVIVLAAGFSIVSAKFQAPLNNFEKTGISSVRISNTEDVEIAGKWNLKVQVPGQQLDVTLDLSQEEKAFSGTMSSMLGDGKVINGTIKEKEFSALIQANIQGQDMEIQMSGQVEGEKMSGSLSVPNMDAMSFEGAKTKQQ